MEIWNNPATFHLGIGMRDTIYVIPYLNHYVNCCLLVFYFTGGGEA